MARAFICLTLKHPYVVDMKCTGTLIEGNQGIK